MQEKTHIGFASKKEAASYLGLAEVTITQRVLSGEIPHRRFGKAVRIPWSWLHSQLDAAFDPDRRGETIFAPPMRKKATNRTNASNRSAA